MSAWYFLVNDFESSIKISLWPRANTNGVLNMQTISDYYTRSSFVLDGWKRALSRFGKRQKFLWSSTIQTENSLSRYYTVININIIIFEQTILKTGWETALWARVRRLKRRKLKKISFFFEWIKNFGPPHSLSLNKLILLLV